jgi:hypothetical protein
MVQVAVITEERDVEKILKHLGLPTDWPKTRSDFSGERLVACHNPELRKLRGHKRRSLAESG